MAQELFGISLLLLRWPNTHRSLLGSAVDVADDIGEYLAIFQYRL
jgi:hypothetical protein